MLRSYDSRREPPPEFDCRIWEAGRATCAIGLAFKPIQIGQSVFHDDGAGTFNPAPHALDEAAVNEWPGRDIGVFVSVGTGKRPRGSDQNNPMWYDGFLGDFADARRRLVAKIEGCEKIHEYMQREHLLKRGVNAENYYRLNVEIGVGEFGMNEWNRLAEISISTKRYLNRPPERTMVQSAAAKLARIHRANERLNIATRLTDVPESGVGTTHDLQTASPLPASEVFAVELPGDMPATFGLPNAAPTAALSGSAYRPSSSPTYYSPRQSYDSGADHLSIPQHNQAYGNSYSHSNSSGSASPRSSSDRFTPPTPPSRQHAPPGSAPPAPAKSVSASSHPTNDADDHLVVSAPTPEQWRNASASSIPAAIRPPPLQPQPSYPHNQHHQRIEPPPLPPKTPLLESSAGRGGTSGSPGRRPPPPPAPHNITGPVSSFSSYTALLDGPPYPLDDEAPPPPVNKARKPEYRRR